MTREEFIECAIAVHGTKYDYSLVTLNTCTDKVCIICPIHSEEFWMTARKHYIGQGCYQCSKVTCAAKLSRETATTFITRANKIHAEKYNYHKVKYINNKTPVIIECALHGEFKQSPKMHLIGQGCPTCARDNKATSIDEFIKQAGIIHSGKYTYGNTIYVVNHEKVIITCPSHGDFLQEPRIHLSGYGCRECSRENSCLSREEFICRAQKIHDNKYTYDNTIYVNGETKVLITCPKHGDFAQAPANHVLNGHGCMQCFLDSNRLSQSDFINAAHKIHHNKYHYDKVSYINNNTDVIITCPKHGDFHQRPNNHTAGLNGCPACKESKGEIKIREFLLSRNISFKSQCRIPSCKNKRALPFDFGIYCAGRLVGLVEYNGAQHYKEVSFRFNQKEMTDNLRKVKLHDGIKHKYCRDNNIPLLVIPYTLKNQLEVLVEKFLSNIGVYNGKSN